MQSIINTIKNHNMISEGDIIGVAVSGGSDSMTLLHFLATHREDFGIQVVAVHFNHSIRPTSDSDMDLVTETAKELGIRVIKTTFDVPTFCNQKGLSIEQGARECRYNFFDSLITKGIITKIALAHHINDQAETILMHILRGSGLTGARGMAFVRDSYIRPMLNTEKHEIMTYIKTNYIEYADDETNFCNDYNRNYIRNTVLPSIKERYPNVIRAIVNFGNTCNEDNSYINSQVPYENIIRENNVVRIPLTYFLYDKSIVTRLIFRAISYLGIHSDIERKHIEIIIDLANNCANGSRIDLSNNLTAHREYDYLSITSRVIQMNGKEKPFKVGNITFENFGTIFVDKTDDLSINTSTHIIDAKKIPPKTIWRYRQDGDEFEKFGGHKKKLRSYFIDRKIPARIRGTIPVLANGNQILLIAGLEISNSVRIDENTKTAYSIQVNKK